MAPEAKPSAPVRNTRKAVASAAAGPAIDSTTAPVAKMPDAPDAGMTFDQVRFDSFMFESVLATA